MTKKYIIVDPLTGLNTEVLTVEERNSTLASICVNFFLSQVHNNPYSIAEVNSDGTETWRNASGEETLNPAQIEELVKLELEQAIKNSNFVD